MIEARLSVAVTRTPSGPRSVAARRVATPNGMWCQRLQRAYNRPAYAEARRALTQLQGEVDDRRPAAWRKGWTRP